MTITIADGRGALWQWDTGRRLRVGVSVPQPNAAAWEAES